MTKKKKIQDEIKIEENEKQNLKEKKKVWWDEKCPIEMTTYRRSVAQVNAQLPLVTNKNKTESLHSEIGK